MIGAALLLLVASPSCYQPPVQSPVTDPFRAPVCAYCPGNRGLEYEPRFGSAVVAAASGSVTFNGAVAGVRYVVVEQTDGRLATYGRLAVAHVAVGAVVAPGDRIGTTTDRFYFGLRENGQYVDPAPLLGTAHYRLRLVPIDGSPPRSPPSPTLRCAARP